MFNDVRNCGACDARCAGAEACVGGECVCRAGLTACGAGCVDLQADPRACGACDTACADTELCDRGECVPIDQGCGNGLAECRVSGGMACVDLDQDPLHCGDCADAACGADELCIDGNCRNFAPATGCSTCPCDAVCDRALDGWNCCEVSGAAVCVAGGCP
jgi:hypothetical protein